MGEPVVKDGRWGKQQSHRTRMRLLRVSSLNKWVHARWRRMGHESERAWREAGWMRGWGNPRSQALGCVSPIAINIMSSAKPSTHQDRV